MKQFWKEFDSLKAIRRQPFKALVTCKKCHRTYCCKGEKAYFIDGNNGDKLYLERYRKLVPCPTCGDLDGVVTGKVGDACG